MKQIVVIGGGLSGLIASILLVRAGFKVKLLERKRYPFHRVCGEYISNEVKPFLKKNGLLPAHVEPAEINKFQLTSINGESAKLPLDLGGFGLSRYVLDNFLAEKSVAAGVELIHERVVTIDFTKGRFFIKTNHSEYEADIVLGAHGKRSTLDKNMDRDFVKRKSPYIGVKYHVRYGGHDQQTVALHNFEGGYCGINRVENDIYNLCYLGERRSSKLEGTIENMERNVLMKNPFLNRIFSDATFVFDKPVVINEISFETKRPVEQHVLMCGDAAGMITPLCGNGMAIAIHSAKIAAETIMQHASGETLHRDKLEADYSHQWNSIFKRRLQIGRRIQHMFGAPWLSNTAVAICNSAKPVANYLMSKTHGQVF
ncbi:MAG: NAD(P)/FAD-dependent oxidoreductase [Bacteroidota bacterium]